MRLIDADTLIDDIRKHSESYFAEDFAHEWVDKQPTVDAVEVVRCKDCTHAEPWYRDKSRCFLWCETGIGVFDDGYCSYGKRKDDEQNG